MNPIKFLFENVKFLGFETEILEACEWDEDRAKFVTEEFQRCLAHSEKNISGFHTEDFKKTLSSSLGEKEVEACLCILERCMIDFSLSEEAKYEN